jgi:hypothetical protein
MASRQKQMEEVKAALAALQEEIQEAKEERKAAKNQLEKATLEGKSISPYEKLLESASTNLTRLGQKEAELLKRETKLTCSHPSSDEETQEISPISDSSAKRQKVDTLIEKSKKYLFRTEKWGCITIIGKRRAVTFAHTPHNTLKVGDEMEIWATENDAQYNVKVLKINVESDWILLESEVNLCDEEPKKAATADGRRYFQLGLSATTQQESPFSVSEGVVSSSRYNKLGHMLGSAGANPGDSGGGCFDSGGCLVGINVGCENVPISLEKDTGAQIYDKISSRYAARAHIIPIIVFQSV